MAQPPSRSAKGTPKIYQADSSDSSEVEAGLPRKDDVGFLPIPNSTRRRANLLRKFKCRIMQVRSFVPRQQLFSMPYQKPYTSAVAVLIIYLLLGASALPRL